MNRLKHYLLNMQSNTTTYKEMYDGKSILVLPNPDQDPEVQYDPVYGHEDISCEISYTHKLAYSKPTLTWSIPIDKLGFDTATEAAADHCLRAFIPYIDELNAGLITAPVPMTKTESIMFISRGERYLCATRRILLFVRRRIISAEAETRHICWTMTFPVLRKCVCASGCRYNCPKENSEKQFKCFAATCPPLWICLSRSSTS